MAQFTVNATRFDPYKNFKFRVKWDGRYVAGVSKCSALKRTTEVVEHREGGDPSSARKSPGRTKYEAITLERGVTHDVDFEQWANKVWNFGSGLGSEVSLKDFRKDLIIEVYNEAGQLALAFKVYRAWVSEFQSLPDLDANANAVAIQHVKLENEGWERDYDVTEPTVDSQVVTLKSSGAEALFVAGTPKFAAQAIRKAAEIGWKPTILINFPSSSVAGTLKPAGLENSIGVIVGTPNKDPNDPKWQQDAGVRAYRAFFEKYLAGADITNTSYLTGYQQGMLLEQILNQCGSDLSRANILKQAKSLRDFVLPTTLPGIRINTSAGNNQVWTQMQLQRWNGKSWDQFGEVLDAGLE